MPPCTMSPRAQNFVGVSRRSVMRCCSPNSSPTDLASAAKICKPAQRRLINVLSENIAWEAQVSVFESLAGRSAMLGFAVAAVLELTTQQALFSAPSVGSLLQLSAGCVAVPTLLGLVVRPTLGAGLRESVLSSLTAVQRSAAATPITANLDQALDTILTRTFDSDWTDVMVATQDAPDPDRA